MGKDSGPANALALDPGYTGRDNLEAMRDAHNYNAWLRNLVTTRAKKSDHIVDFGAGCGTFAAMLAGLGYDITCIEPDEPLRAEITRAGLKSFSSAEGLQPDSIDFVYTYNVLEHIENDNAQVKALASILKPGGSLLIFVPAFEGLYSAMDAKVGHFRRYRRAGVVRMLERNGLKIDFVHYGDTAGFFASALYKFIDPGTGDIDPRTLKFFDRYLFPINRILDPLCMRLLGKNLIAVATKHV
ncbi:MAG: methyltransferase domain-containing protein [Steroidobacteraceae bacterium]